MIGKSSIILFVIITAFSIHSSPAAGNDLAVLKNDLWTISIEPNFFQVIISPPGKTEFQLSASQMDLNPARNVKQSGNRLQWEYPSKGIAVSVHLQENDLNVRIQSEKAGKFTWPVVEESANLRGLIWPRWEGCYIPLDNTRWTKYLIDSGAWNTLDGLCMPFWGLDCGDYSLTCIVTNRFNNEIRFSKRDEKLSARFMHEFPPNHAEKEYGFLIHLGNNSSPVEPAKYFRHWLIERGAFVSMREKMKRVPKVERLLGAPHVYLWGDALFTRHDIYPDKWKAFCRKLVEQSQAGEPSPGKRIKLLMKPERWSAVAEISTMEWPYDYIKTQVTDELCRLLENPDFFEDTSWRGISLSGEIESYLTNRRDALPVSEICRMNGLLLRAAYPDCLLPVEDWGNGASVKMLKRFRQAGFDRMRLCLDSWLGVEKHPEVARQADEMDYLFGTYDSYHSIHDPSLAGSDETWHTAQFDRELYETGPIVGKNDRKKQGFKGTGYTLSPIAARPYVEKRVDSYMKNIPFNYFFMDCDAYGEFYDDYSPLHPSTQAEDAAARNARMAWIRDTYRVVIGSEGGCSFTAPVVHLVEGMFGPCFVDEDMKDKNSKYFRGRYFPPDGPEIYVKQVPLKEKFQFFYYDPRFRLPLYEIVFHDSVLTTHHWGNGSLKYTDVLDTVALTELLYMVPPLYHMNLNEFAKHRKTMKRHYEFFSPLHRELGFSQMTGFAWLSPDRLVQRTVFDGEFEMIANFKTTDFNYEGITIPGCSILAKRRGSDESRIFTPSS